MVGGESKTSINMKRYASRSNWPPSLRHRVIPKLPITTSLRLRSERKWGYPLSSLRRTSWLFLRIKSSPESSTQYLKSTSPLDALHHIVLSRHTGARWLPNGLCVTSVVLLATSPRSVGDVLLFPPARTHRRPPRSRLIWCVLSIRLTITIHLSPQ